MKALKYKPWHRGYSKFAACKISMFSFSLVCINMGKDRPCNSFCHLANDQNCIQWVSYNQQTHADISYPRPCEGGFLLSNKILLDYRMTLSSNCYTNWFEWFQVQRIRQSVNLKSIFEKYFECSIF